MSTEHQRYSNENQSDAIAQYAARCGFDIIRTYSDSGKSGLRIEGRDALKQLLADVESGHAEFKAILVYDVSRWGRFQDADESAYYEYVCRRAGIEVRYCAEQFENDGSVASTIVKTVKRAMAGEYSRELSAKVFAGQCRLIELGYRQGGTAGYGLRRRLVDQNGRPKAALAIGEHKSLQTDRVILEPGPPEEVETVRQMFRMFVEDRKSETEIAEILNQKQIMTDLGRPWTWSTVRRALTNEKYVGNNIFNRVSCKLKKKKVSNPPDMWIRATGAFAAIVDHEIFAAAQSIFAQRKRQRLSDAEMLTRLRRLYEQHGVLSSLIIDQATDLPSPGVYTRRFGALRQAYQLVGFNSERNSQHVAIKKALRCIHADVVADVVANVARLGGTVSNDHLNDILTVNDEFTISIVVVRCEKTPSGTLRWHLRFDSSSLPDIVIVLRMDEQNRQIRDYYLLPRIDMTEPRLRLAERNGAYLDAYRFDSLNQFFRLATRTPMKVFA